jgi:hypothetical protein
MCHLRNRTAYEPAHPQNRSRELRSWPLAGSNHLESKAVNSGEQLRVATAVIRAILAMRDEQLSSKFRR